MEGNLRHNSIYVNLLICNLLICNLLICEMLICILLICEMLICKMLIFTLLKGIYPEFQVIRGFSQKIPAGLLSYNQIHS